MKATSYLKLSIAAAVATILLKMTAWWLTDSVGYLSDGLESFVNLAGATFALYMVTLAAMPADAAHPFGHGKAEYFSAGFEGVLIFAAAIAIIATSVERFMLPVPLGNFGWGTALSVLSTLINFLVARLLLKASMQLHSIALEADARHLMADVWTTVGVIGGVGLAMLTEAWWLDPVVAIAVALNIMREGGGLVRRAVDGLMDRSLPQSEHAALHAVLARYEPEGCTFGELLTRSAGPQRFAHIDVRVAGSMSVSIAHDLVDRIEHAVLRETGIVLTTHIEPQEHA
ncbi:MAG: cation diffusion facilitator family transporter [Gallionella sp.]|nr:cation diffusion facilitator family transporter [Gallionella sp.]